MGKTPILHRAQQKGEEEKYKKREAKRGWEDNDSSVVSLLPRLGKVKQSKSCSVVFNSLRLHGLYSSGNSPGQNTGVGSLSLLQGIFSTQGSNPGLLHCWQILYQLSHKGKGRGGVTCPHCNAWHHTRHPFAATTTKSYHLLHVDWLPGSGVSAFPALSHLILKQSFQNLFYYCYLGVRSFPECSLL